MRKYNTYFQNAKTRNKNRFLHHLTNTLYTKSLKLVHPMLSTLDEQIQEKVITYTFRKAFSQILFSNIAIIYEAITLSRYCSVEMGKH